MSSHSRPAPRSRQLRRFKIPQDSFQHLNTALEASCGALITLDALRARLKEPACDVEGDIASAVESLRVAVQELRNAIQAGSSSLSAGFVRGDTGC